MAIRENKILVSYTIEDQVFKGGKLMYVAGRENAEKDDLGTIVLPRPALDVKIDHELPDPVVFSYSNTEDNIVRLREVLVKIDSDAGNLSTCTVTVLVPEVEDNWVSLTKDATLVMPAPPNAAKTDPPPTVPALRNPHGLAQLGNYLYFIDYDNHLIVYVTKDVLENAAQGAPIMAGICDLESIFIDGAEKARGQAIIALEGKLYALFISTGLEAYDEHDLGYLVRLSVSDSETGALAVDTFTRTGLNSQSIIPVSRKVNGVDTTYLLIPSIGGEQFYDGRTNGTDSNIGMVEAELVNWPEEVPIIITGDPYPPPTPPTPPEPGKSGDPDPDPPPPAPTAYDIHAVAAAMRDGASRVYILTQSYDNQANEALWKLYDTSVDVLAGFLATGPFTLTNADAQSGFDTLDEGVMVPPAEEGVDDDIYFWDLLYEQTPKDKDDEDRLWLVLGSPFLVTRAEAGAYGSPSAEVSNPFMMFSCIGGVNVNSVDLTIETLHQAKREVSLKRGVRSSRLATATARAAKSVVSTSATAAEDGTDAKK
jgi:hypothetical protein